MLNIKDVNISPLVKDTNVYVLDNILDESLYLELMKSFPYEDMQRKDIHNKVALNKYNTEAVNNFLEKNKSWHSFVKYFFSHDFVDILNKYFSFSTKKDQIFTLKNIKIGYEFSILKNGARVVPHKDKYGKLFSFVFYFVPNGWADQNEYGGTQFYEPINKLLNLKIFNDSADYNSMKLITEIKPTNNRLMVFEPNNTSWHGVAPIKTTDTFGRPAFIVTVHRKLYFHENLYNLISPLTSRIQNLIN